MLPTYEIQLKGIVQGVGFRPYVYRLAESMQVPGWVSNTANGVYIRINASEAQAALFYESLLAHPPANAHITAHEFRRSEPEEFKAFTIRQQPSSDQPDLLLTPDIALCENCRQEIRGPENKRYRYPFTTCLNCGPRYSISKDLPYEREHTAMAPFSMCPSCSSEYTDLNDRRFYSQTNSCKTCAVTMHLYASSGNEITHDTERIFFLIKDAIKEGKIIALKGNGGYLLLCDATNKEAIETLRLRKKRPSKPFALLYADLKMAAADVLLRDDEVKALESTAAPIVLCPKKNDCGNKICVDSIAPGLDKIGVMLPNSPLLSIIADDAGQPLICTSGNISGSPLIYKDEEALKNLADIADLILTHDREILIPQDDSILQFSENGQRIILRRARGLAPNYFPHTFKAIHPTILAAGAEIKSAFALQHNSNLYISQYLGDQSSLESQESYIHTLEHFFRLFRTKPNKILIDKHPSYFVSQLGKEISKSMNAHPVFEVQHHQAHFGAVLAEHELLQSDVPVLGFIWDGTGYGDDQQIWGSEIFIYKDKGMERVGHLEYFPHLLGDKMSKEPRLSALSLLERLQEYLSKMESNFSRTEWTYFQKLLTAQNKTYTSSMGRFLDGLACLLGIGTHNSYEGESAMLMEALARQSQTRSADFYPMPFVNGILDWTPFLIAFMEDIARRKERAEIAWKVFYSLARSVERVSDEYLTNKLAFSGGVFQNALMTDLLIKLLAGKKELYFHRQLSPNDECIGFGQLACYQISSSKVELRVGLSIPSTYHAAF